MCHTSRDIQRGNFRFSVHNGRMEATTRSDRAGARADGLLAPYLPRLVHEPGAPTRGAARYRVLDGSLVSVDISGFTALAERLSAKGKAGAEELVQRISACFDAPDRGRRAARRRRPQVPRRRAAPLLPRRASRRSEPPAPRRTCSGRSSRSRATTSSCGCPPASTPASATSSSREAPHRELLVAGPGATRVFELEDLATAGEIVLSAETAAEVDASWLGEEREGARVMQRLEPGASTIPPPPDVPARASTSTSPRRCARTSRSSSGEAEHRQVTVAFVKLSQNRRADRGRRAGGAARTHRHARRGRRSQRARPTG